MAVHQRRTGLHPSPVVGRKGGGHSVSKKNSRSEKEKQKKENRRRRPRVPNGAQGTVSWTCSASGAEKVSATQRPMTVAEKRIGSRPTECGAHAFSSTSSVAIGVWSTRGRGSPRVAQRDALGRPYISRSIKSGARASRHSYSRFFLIKPPQVSAFGSSSTL